MTYNYRPGKQRVRHFVPKPKAQIAPVAQRMLIEQMRKMEKTGQNTFAQERS